MRTRGRAALAILAALGAGLLGVGGAWAAGTTASTAGTTTTKTSMTTTTPKTTQQTMTGKVTKVSTTAHSFVVNGKTVYVSKKTTYHLIHGGLGGIKVNRRYRVVVKTTNGKYYVTSVTRL